jgi:hypothetical protein
MSGVREYLSWVTTMLETPVKKRWEWVNLIVDGIRSYRPKETAQLSKADEATVKYLSDAILDDKTFEIIGFGTNLSYVRIDAPNRDMLKYIWIHPWGTPPLVLKHRRLPVFITVGPGIRWNDTILRELKDNGYTDSVIGATG